MLEVRSFEGFLRQAKNKERKFDWLEAVELYKNALKHLTKDRNFWSAGDTEEKIGFCYYRSAMQAETENEFKDRMRQASENYKRAKESYDKLKRSGKTPRILRCNAMIEHIRYWLTGDVHAKRRLLKRSCEFLHEALGKFEEEGDALEYSKTYNQLSLSITLRFFLDRNPEVRKKMIREAAENGERVIEHLTSINDTYELTRAFVKTACFLQAFGFYFLDLNERETYYLKAQEYWHRANKLSEEEAAIELLSSAALAALESEWGWGTDQTLTNFAMALKHCRKTRDRLIVGWALDWLSFHTLFKAQTTESSEEAKKLCKRALKYSKEASSQYSLIAFRSPLWGALWVEAPKAEYYSMLATSETTLNRKRSLLEKAVEAALIQLKKAENTGYPEVIMYSHHVFSNILFSLAKIKANSKKQLLEKALKHSTEAIGLIERFLPFYYWKRGRMQALLADVKTEQVELVKNTKDKKHMLQEALLAKEDLLKLAIEYATFLERKGAIPPIFVDIGTWQYGYGNMLNRLYEFTDNKSLLRRAIEAFEKAAEIFEKLDLTSHKAECYWKAGQTFDALSDHLKAAGRFNMASNNYRRAAKKFPQLARFYLEQALYMQAWGEIEKAKYHHAAKRYGHAEKHYEKAATLHESTEQWNFLTYNYLAWARLVQAEQLSRREQKEQARDLFKKAAAAFIQAKKSIKAKLEKTEGTEEKEMLPKLISASDTRREYCLGRIALEEARILQRKGNHIEGSEKYASAVKIFQKIGESHLEPSRKEIQSLILLCQAWEKMLLAEAKASSTMYGEAAELFKKAKEQSLDHETSLLALANSSLCKALEAGTQFEYNRKPALYSMAKKHLEAAANYYLKAGFKNAFQYVVATQYLFDAYMYVNKAETETEARKKAQYYEMADQILQASAHSYRSAKHSEKSKEVKKLSQSIKEKQQLANSLRTVLGPPPAASATSSFSLTTPDFETPVGLERLAHANIQAYVTSPKEITVGEQLEVRLDLVNVGKGSGLIVRVEGLMPQGFKATDLISEYRFEKGSLEMEGKRLGPAKVESVKIVMEATEVGLFELCPTVVYTDDVGKFWTYRSHSVQLTVHPPFTFKFSKESAERVFHYLVQAFIEDYMMRRLFIQDAGWRSFVEIAENAEVSLRSVYGSGPSYGSAVSELKRRGLIDTRFFLGKRGRGGKIIKARISYEKEPVKRFVDRKVAGN